MLILTRKVGESIVIADDGRISVLEIKGRQVRIGINAPSEVTIHREEIYRAIQEQNGHSTPAAKRISQSTDQVLRTRPQHDDEELTR